MERADQKLAHSQEDLTKYAKYQTPEQTNNLDETAQRYQRHALFFYSKWKEAEKGNVHVMEESSLEELNTEIGRGSFGVCTLAKYGSRTVAVKQQENYATSQHEARITSKLCHPNVASLIGYIEAKQ